jgi:hypothetical protein
MHSNIGLNPFLDHSDIRLKGCYSDIISDIGLTFVAISDIWKICIYMGISCSCSTVYTSGKIADSSCGKGTCLLFWISDIRFIQYQLNLYQISQSNIWYQSSVQYQMFSYQTEKLNIGYKISAKWSPISMPTSCNNILFQNDAW